MSDRARKVVTELYILGAIIASVSAMWMMGTAPGLITLSVWLLAIGLGRAVRDDEEDR